MQYTTEQYRQEMRLPYRGASHIWIYIGLINNDAQRSAHITSSFSGDETYLYTESSSAYTGVTSTESDGHIRFDFEGTENNIAGLTVTFNTAPASVTVTNGDKTEIYGVDGTEFTVDDGFNNCSYLKITPNSGKLSVKKILFGIGLQFSDRQIMNTSRQNMVDHISNELPSKSFTFTINNRAKLFNKDNPYGYASFLEERQEVTYEYGRELSDGTLYKIKGGKVYLKSWSSDDYEAKFSCTGLLDFLDDKFYKGQYYEEGISALDLAEIVLEDAGITHYILDPSLARYLIHNPLPILTHKECLQAIANACTCIMFEDRDGNVCLKNANLPSFIGDVKFIGATDYSIPSAIFDDNSLFNYADAENNYVVADGSFMFLPEDSSYLQVGFVSSQLANGSGQFTNNPSIEASFLSEFHMTCLYLLFSTIYPTSMTVKFYLSGEEVDSQTITSFSPTVAVSYDGVVDGMKILFNGASPNQRIHLNSISIKGYLEYELTYHELKNTPVATSLERVSNLNVHYFTYSKQEELPEGVTKEYVSMVDIENEDGGITKTYVTSEIPDTPIATFEVVAGENLLTFSRPCYDISVSSGTILESGAYYCRLQADSDGQVNVTGKYFVVADSIFVHQIHEKGTERTSNNPLLSSLTMAKQQASWLKDHYDDDLEYSLTYRGDPVLDADDLIYLENHFVAKNEIRIVNETLNTNIGMSFTCTIQGRRTSYQVDATTQNMIVGRAYVGETL